MLRKLHCGIKKDGGVVWVEGCLLILHARSARRSCATSKKDPKTAKRPPKKNPVEIPTESLYHHRLSDSRSHFLFTVHQRCRVCVCVATLGE